MNKDEAKNLVFKTFEQAFDESRFLFFVKNLLNDLDESKSQTWSLIPESHRDAIKSYKRIGQYTDKNKNVIDILSVNVKKDNTLEKARTLQRNFIARHLRQRNHEAALVAFHTDDYEDWRFSFVKLEYDLKKKGDGKIKTEEQLSPAKRYSFLVGVNERSHTAQNQFVNLLSDKNDTHTLSEIEEAFNIETVTKEFFQEYRDLLIKTKNSLDKILSSDPKVKDEFEKKGVDSVNFAKKLLGQIVFLYFLQKKGWFGVPRDAKWGEGSKRFLRKLFEKKHSDYKNFFNEILEPLFYQVLRVGEDRKHLDYYYSPFNCRIPFLNGGLFDPIGDYDWVKTDITLPNELFSNKKDDNNEGDGILDIFDLYNFTVAEDEPLEKEVAIDPELLGKAYEKFNAIRPDNFDEYLKVLKSGKKGEETKFNKQYGVYYTPREIVHYMCRESLINYLASEFSDKSEAYQKIDLEQLDAFGNTSRKGQLPLEAEYKSVPYIPKSDIETLINNGELFGENEAVVEAKGKETDTYNYKLPDIIRTNAELIDTKLSDILICDPAVGSGAFPVGMMHEIVSTRNLLSIFIRDNSRSVYKFKRNCIEKSLYGVDIDAGAVEIAKLRLWLSLVVDEEDINNIKPLPNLDYKIVCGDSLLNYPYKPMGLDTIENLKQEFIFETNPSKKNDLRGRIDNSIYGLFNNSEKTVGYKVTMDFRINFSEAFHHKNGFDIVIGNPPYFSLDTVELLLKKLLAKNYHEVFSSQGNIYFFFIKKSLEILKPSGTLMFINENYYLSSKNAFSLRKYLQENISIHLLINFRNVQLFENVNTLNVINSFIREIPNEKIVKALVVDDSIRNMNSFNISNFLISEPILYPQKKLDVNQWLFTTTSKVLLKNKIDQGSLPLIKCVDMGQGMTSGNNDIFILPKERIKQLGIEKEVLKKYIKTKDIKPFLTIFRDQYFIYSTKNLDLDNYPQLKKYLTSNKKLLLERYEIKRDPSRWYSISVDRNKSFFEEYNEKLLTPLYSKGNKFAYDDCKKNNFYVLTDIYILVPKDKAYPIKYLLGLLNSKLFNFYVNNFGKLKRDGYYEYSKNTMSSLPIKKNNSFQKILFIVDEILRAKIVPNADTKKLEDQIDLMVYKLYSLTYKEIKIIDSNIGELISEEEYEKFEI